MKLPSIQIILVVLSSCFIFLSCNNDEQKECLSNCLIFRGAVTDAYTGEAIKNGEVYLSLDPNSSFGSDGIEKARTTTNKKGEFELVLEGSSLYSKSNSWVITCKKEGYLWIHAFDNGIKFNNIDSTNYDDPIYGNIELIPSAKLNVDLDVELNLLSSFKYQVYYGTEPTEIQIWENGHYQHTIIHQVAGDRYTYLKFFPGTLAPIIDSVYIESHKSQTIEFKY